MNDRPIDLLGFSHVCIAVSDAERALGFYRDLLGFEPFFDVALEGPSMEAVTGEPGAKGRMIGGRLGGTVVELLELAHRRLEPGGHRARLGYTSISLSVADLDVAAERVRRAGYHLAVEPVEIGGVRMLFVHDPDGTPIQLIEYPNGARTSAEMWQRPRPEQPAAASTREDAALGLLAATMGSRARAYHTGYVVRDLERAMAVLGEAMGVRWTSVMDYPGTRLRTPEGIAEIPRLRFTYSTLPGHVELIEEAPGSLWVADAELRGHHIAVWADDLQAESARLTALGLPLHTHGLDADDGMSSFAYHETPFGLYIELVDSVAKTFYPQWFAEAPG